MIVCTLDRILTQRGLSQRALARLSSVHRATIARPCHDDWVRVDRRVLDVLCASLHLKARQLLVWEEDA
jgi:DNA-binding Xre family transcriptional regulator